MIGRGVEKPGEGRNVSWGTVGGRERYVHTYHVLAPLTPPPHKANWPPYHRAETIRLVGAMYVKGGSFLCLTLSGPFFFSCFFLASLYVHVIHMYKVDGSGRRKRK